MNRTMRVPACASLPARFPLSAFPFLLWCFFGFLRAEAQTNLPPVAVEIPIRIHQGELLVETRVNGSEPLTFKLDTGFGITTIHPDLVQSLKVTRSGHTTIIGIAGEEEAETYSGAVFDFGGVENLPPRVARCPLAA